ncbi:HEPN domain-containing protein [Leptolyngbya sp. FACHB-321]|uniref:ApeA N-terminal domain 1-containing protein n=1 Tax=Leptolyngbya sp. FACHB-321 TaxID=2692807 RepID=UPI001A7E6C3B|nr:HEPN domain-containing protein [Leptolyngbya sp. FACHB-321]
MKGFEHVGQWWLPEFPNRKVSGTLKFEPATGGKLELIGSLTDESQSDQPSFPPIILGECLAGKITLLNNSFSESKLTLEEIGLTIYHTRLICDGIHLQSESDLKFLSISVHYSYLNQWLGVRGFNIDRSSIRYEQDVTVTQIHVNENIKLSLDIRTRKKEEWMENVQLSQLSYITIIFSELHLLEEAEKVLRHLRNFLSFAVMCPVYPLDVTGVMLGEYFDSMDGTYKKGYIPVKIFRSLSNASGKYSGFIPRSAGGFYSNILFAYPGNPEKFEILIKNWFEKSDWLEIVCELYFYTFYEKLYPQNEFLILTQALEVFHRKNPKFKQYESSEEAHKEKISRILKVVPAKDLDWLERRLEHSNEKRLRKRLQDILASLRSVIKQLSSSRRGFSLISSAKSQSSLSQQIAFNRNCLTHYDESCKEKAADNRQLYYMVEKLKIIICLSLMKELGFEEEEITVLLSESNIGLLMDSALTESYDLKFFD